MIALGYKVINNDCPEGAPSSGRSPGRGVDSYTIKSENLSLTSSEISPLPSVGGDKGEGGPKGLYLSPPPAPSPIEGGGNY
jgi:hypothetical protein